jgi:hypothetical protein
MGIIDDDGVQWERTNCCGEFVKFDDLLYMQPTKDHPYGLDICANCADNLDAVLESIRIARMNEIRADFAQGKC